MYKEVQTLLKRVTSGEVDQSTTAQAATKQISGMSPDELTSTLENAVGNATSSGDTDISKKLTRLISQYGSDPSSLKKQTTTMISSDPKILEYFPPDFAKGILTRL